MNAKPMLLTAVLLIAGPAWAADVVLPPAIEAMRKAREWDVTYSRKDDDVVIVADAVTLVLTGQGTRYRAHPFGGQLEWCVKGYGDGHSQIQGGDFTMNADYRDGVCHVSINGVAMEVRDGAKRLVIGDASYDLVAHPVIEIAADGGSKLRPAEGSK